MREYFSHDLNARNDRKLVRLAMKHGMTGVGTFWCIVEMLFEEQGRIMLSECERIAFELRVQSDIVASVLRDFELFQMDDTWFWSESVNKRIKAQISVSQGARKAAKVRWERFKNQTVNANALQPQSEGNAIAMQEKKRKEKESKENIVADAPQPEVASTPKAKQNLPERKEAFKETLIPHLEKYGRTMLNEFFAYWTEENKSKTAFRYEGERFWDLPKRLATWHRNQKQKETDYSAAAPGTSGPMALGNKGVKFIPKASNEGKTTSI
jgi:hypothetical protein